MKFENRVPYSEVTSACFAAELLLTYSSPMIEEMSKKDDFRYNSGLGESVAMRLIQNPKAKVPVFTYKPINPFTKATGYRNSSGVHINYWRLSKMSHAELVGLLLHEWAHECGFNHGTGWFANYKTQEKCLYSVPYWLSSNIERWL
jgi:hypothetical protein